MQTKLNQYALANFWTTKETRFFVVYEQNSNEKKNEPA